MSENGSSSVPTRRLAGLLMGGALAGKVLGFAREIAMAQVLGISIVADSFRSALTAVLLPLALLQGDTVPAVLIPLHRQWRAEGVAARRFTSLTVALLLISLALTGVVELFAGQWVQALVGGFSPEALALTCQFVRVMALAMPASVLFNCLISIEISLGYARLTSLRASVQNIGVMIGIAAMVATGKPISIAWGFTAAFIATVSWGTWMLVREGELSLCVIRPTTAWETLLSFLFGLRAMVAQPIAEQLQTWVERLLASASAPGTVASLDYARTLTDSTLYVVSQPIGLAVLANTPGMSKLALLRRVEAIARPLLIIAMPASVFLLLFAPDVVRLIFARGAFSAEGVVLTSQALFGISAGLWAATLGMILVRQLNGERRNGSAAVVLVLAYAVNMTFNLLLAPKLGALGLGLGEAMRGIALLIGASLAVGCGRMILRLIIQILPGCGAFWLAGVAIHFWTTSVIGSVVLGLATYAVIVSMTGATLIPGVTRWALAAVSGKASMKAH